MTQVFEDSLLTLALVAMQYADADGFAYFQRSKSGALVRSQSGGRFIREKLLADHEFQRSVSFPLRRHAVIDGILVFSFPEKTGLEAARTRLVPLVTTIEKVWTAQFMAEKYRHILESIIELETSILDSKVVSRVRGMLNREPTKDGIDAVIKHVDSVFRSSPATCALTQILEDLQKEALERDWAERAKSILQGLHGMSEQEAHAYLRRTSRHSRRPLIEVARQVVEGQNPSLTNR